MGIDRSVSVGYGLIFPTSQAPDILKDEYGWVGEESVNAWLDKFGFESIGGCVCGNFMSGEEYVFFFVQGTQLLHLGGYDLESEPYELDGDDVTAFELSELARLRSLLNLNELVGWKLIGNTS